MLTIPFSGDFISIAVVYHLCFYKRTGNHKDSEMRQQSLKFFLYFPVNYHINYTFDRFKVEL